MNIEEATQTALDFLAKTMEKQGKVARARKTEEGGWEVEIEVIEESEYIKALGIPTAVYDKNLYIVGLDENLEVISCDKRELREVYNSKE
ncbi:hypothetical protein H8E77_31230 [bacterium]|nr:hypothetical protein [bacterium]